ncbi:MAG: hypothetical protein M9916_00955 [Crocinitomicaceae bacterium]|nr:hypothetical protein [Crocinitomicaceae bacterium]
MKTILSIQPTEKQTFLIQFKELNVIKTAETKVFDSSAFMCLKNAKKKYWNDFLKKGAYRVIKNVIN